MLLDRNIFLRNQKVTKQLKKFEGKIEFGTEKNNEKNLFFQLKNIVKKQIIGNINTSYLTFSKLKIKRSFQITLNIK